MKFLRTLLLAASALFLDVSASHAQLPPLNSVAGPTTSAALRSIITDESGTGVFLTTNGSGVSLTGVPAASAIPGTTTLTGGALNANGLLFNSGNILTNLASANSGVLITSGAGVPSIATTLPSGLTIPNTQLTSNATVPNGLLYLNQSRLELQRTMAVSGAASNANYAQINTGTVTGSTSDFSWCYTCVIVVESIDQSAASVGSTLNGLLVNHNGGTGSGARNGFLSTYSHNAATSTPSARAFYTGVFSNVVVNASDGGGVGTEKASFYGWGSLVTAKAAATNLKEIIGGEFDLASDVGSSFLNKIILQLVTVNSDAVKGSVIDAAIVITGDSTVTAKLDKGIAFGKTGNLWNIETAGTIIGTYTTTNAMAAAYGVDLRAVTIGTCSFASTGFCINGSGAASVVGLTSTAAITYGGVTLSNSVTGTGSMVLSASPTFTGTVTTAALSSTTGNFSGAITYGGVALANSVTGTGSMALSISPTFTGTVSAAALTQSVGAKYTVASGANQRAGNATLVSGTVTVNNTTVTVNTVVILTRKTSGGTIGTAVTYTVSAGNSFTITTDNVLDTSTFSYYLLEVV